MSKKIFFFDIDGTLADQEDILPSNQKALRELRLKGHTVMIASGRPAGYISSETASYTTAIRYICTDIRDHTNPSM